MILEVNRFEQNRTDCYGPTNPIPYRSAKPTDPTKPTVQCDLCGHFNDADIADLQACKNCQNPKTPRWMKIAPENITDSWSESNTDAESLCSSVDIEYF